MPIYEFHCRDCQKDFEVTQPIGSYDPKQVTCPQCKGANVERRWSSVFAVTSKKS